ncbi:MAG: immunoglobulin domain-containing protein [Verrucomicrobia bacterium]|nr:immunoglobulin domain-containing protein [Verrucomicrobiota bacterium]
MKNNANRIAAAAFASLVIVALIIALTNAGRAHGKSRSATPTVDEIKLATTTETSTSKTMKASQSVVAPYIVKDADNDSPGTNIVTRIVTITAEIGGSAPIALQWQVDRGNGYESITGATNATYRIGNAQVVDSGFYFLFATNAAGHISTTPVQLIVTEGVD